MPVHAKILPARGLVVVTYSGTCRIDETFAIVREVFADPEYRPGFRHLFDTSALDDFEQSWEEFFALQAQLTKLLAKGPGDQIVAYYAPSPAGRRMVSLVKKSWASVSSMIIVAFDDEAEALAFLGQPETTISALLGDGSRTLAPR